jgi:hypothetical protein
MFTRRRIRFVVEPRLPSIPMSLNADALHFSNTRGGVISVLNSRFEAQGDDGINMPTRYQDISGFNADRTAFKPGRLGFVPDLVRDMSLPPMKNCDIIKSGTR